MNKPTTVQWLCQCGRETTVRVWPLVPARVSGPPELCHPAERERIEPAFCYNCEHPIDVGTALEQADEQEADALAARADEENDRRRVERL